MTTVLADGQVVPDLGEAANGPAAFLAHATSILAAYGQHVANAAALPATGFAGQRIYLDDIDAVAWWDDKTAAWQGYWKSYTPTIAGSASATLACSYMIEPNEKVNVRLKITLTAVVTTTLTTTLPVTEHAQYGAGVSYFNGSIALRDTSAGSLSRVVGTPTLQAAGLVSFSYPNGVGLNALVSTGTTPWTWASTDTLDGEFSYRRA